MSVQQADTVTHRLQHPCWEPHSQVRNNKNNLQITFQVGLRFCVGLYLLISWSSIFEANLDRHWLCQKKIIKVNILMNHLIRTSGWLALFFYICQIKTQILMCYMQMLQKGILISHSLSLYMCVGDCMEGNGPARAVEVNSMTLYRVSSLEPH